jgi:hypothetical protein
MRDYNFHPGSIKRALTLSVQSFPEGGKAPDLAFCTGYIMVSDGLGGPPSLLYNGYRVFSGGKGGRGVMLTTHPLLVPRLRKS